MDEGLATLLAWLEQPHRDKWLPEALEDRQLWCAVIYRAYKDWGTLRGYENRWALTPSAVKRRDRLVEEYEGSPVAWLLSEDCAEICSWLGIPHRRLAFHVEQMQRDHCRGRIAAVVASVPPALPLPAPGREHSS